MVLELLNMNLLSDNDLLQMNEDINNLRELASSNFIVNLLKETEADCPDCGYDPITEESTDITCSTCGGLGVIVTTVNIPLQAGVHELSNDNQLEDAGVVQNSMLLLDISITDNDTYNAYINPMMKIEIDGVNYREISRKLRGIGGHNRLLIKVEKITG